MPSKQKAARGGGGITRDVPDVWALLVSDVHLQAQAPVARAGEPDWFAAMARPLAEISRLSDKYNAPVIYAGDIFDRWDARPEVVNFAIEHLPHGFAVPGQHDLPNHSYSEIKRSAYWTLCRAGVLENITPGAPFVSDNNYWPEGLLAYGFPWGSDLTPIETKHVNKNTLRLAVVHRMVWVANYGYTGAPETTHLDMCAGALAGYTTAAFGDNHKGFITTVPGGAVVCNCGGIMRRHTDERDMQPGVGLLHSDGSVTRHYLDISSDVFLEQTKSEAVIEEMLLDMGVFLQELRKLGTDDALDFAAALRRFVNANDISKRAVEIILQAVGNKE